MDESTGLYLATGNQKQYRWAKDLRHSHPFTVAEKDHRSGSSSNNVPRRYLFSKQEIVTSRKIGRQIQINAFHFISFH